MAAIGSLNEKPLHASLKEWYRRDDDLVEHPVDGFVVDLVRDDLLIEIQTRGFSAMRRKFDRLLDIYPIRLVHPIPAVKWIVKLDNEGNPSSRNRSPKRGIGLDVCAELVSFPSLLSHPNFVLEVVMTEEEEVWKTSTKGWRRQGYVVDHRRLISVQETILLGEPRDLAKLVPDGLPDVFTTADIARGLGRTRHAAQEVAYCLRLSGAAAVVGRDKSGIRYRLI